MLPQLFGTVHIPEIARGELGHVRTPPPIRDWLATNPAWLKRLPPPVAAALPLPSSVMENARRFSPHQFEITVYRLSGQLYLKVLTYLTTRKYGGEGETTPSDATGGEMTRIRSLLKAIRQ